MEIEKFKKWFKDFVKIYTSNDNDEYVKHRFDRDSLKTELEVIYANYEFMIGKEVDCYVKRSIISDIVQIRYKEIQKYATASGEACTVDSIVEECNRINYNFEILGTEILWLEKQMKSKRL